MAKPQVFFKNNLSDTKYFTYSEFYPQLFGKELLHQQVTRNRYYQKFADFTDAVLLFFRHIGKKKKLLRERINDNFQKLDVPNFAS